jgi:hypothetical protein
LSRSKIETALQSERNIVPLMLADFSFNTPASKVKIIGKLAPLAGYNGLPIPQGYFSQAMERLRNKFLNAPVDAVLHPASISAQQVAKEQKDKAAAALEDEQHKLTSPENFEELLPGSSPVESPSLLPAGPPWVFVGILSGVLLVVLLVLSNMDRVVKIFAAAPKQSTPLVAQANPSAVQPAPLPSTGVPGQTTRQPSTVAQSPAPATPTAQSQQPSAPEDAATTARKAAIWKSIAAQLDELKSQLDDAASAADKWKADNNDNTAQSISAAFQNTAGKFQNIRVNLDLLRVSYPQYPEIGDALEEVKRSAGAGPIPGNLFDRLLRSLSGVSSTFSKDVAIPYVETALDNIKDFREWRSTTLQKAPR